MASAKSTTNHEEIRKWAEERGGKPACVKRTGAKADDPGIIRINFPGYSGAGSLQEISWEEWFQKFDQNDLCLLYQDTTRTGDKSNFNKIVARKTFEERAAGNRTSNGAKRSNGAKSSNGKATGAKKAAAGTASKSSGTSGSSKSTGVKRATAAKSGSGARKTSSRKAA
ncbi:MAG TPA: hypothetical protein VM328_04485 [Fimbriimonadaceae bacterium]|nr:hypothetical protein [Fimbriimonadaceae bacterium]